MIKIKESNVGALHRDLGVKSGNKIPLSKIMSAKQSKDPAVRKRANFALMAKTKWNKG